MPAPLGLQPFGLGIYIRQIPRAHVITITYRGYRYAQLTIPTRIYTKVHVCGYVNQS